MSITHRDGDFRPRSRKRDVQHVVIVVVKYKNRISWYSDRCEKNVSGKTGPNFGLQERAHYRVRRNMYTLIELIRFNRAF